MPFLRRRRDDVIEEPPPPEPMAREEVAQRLLAAGSASGSSLVESLRPAVRLATRREPDAAIDVAHSKFGGAPDLPRGMGWPMLTTAEGERQPLQFFAQLDLAHAAAQAPAPLELPADGYLSFFADFNLVERPSAVPVAATVLYSTSSSEFVRCGLRMRPLPTVELSAIGIWTWRPERDVAGVEAFGREYEAGLHELAHERYQVTARHQLGGHGPSAGQPDDGLAVFRFDSEPTVEIAWGPEGSSSSLMWTVRPADLAAGQWSESQVTLLPA